jgi:nucleoside-diphosphate-sugar epimerase
LSLAKKYLVRTFINTDTILDKGINYYSLSKSHFKEYLIKFSHDLVCINVELEHFYGPLDDDSKFITSIIHQLVKKVDKIDLTEGIQKRYFLHIDDVVNAFYSIIQSTLNETNGFNNYQVASDEKVEIKEVVELIREITKNKSTILNFGAIPFRQNEIMDPIINCQKIRNLGWKPQVPLIEGLEKTIQLELNYLLK